MMEKITEEKWAAFHRMTSPESLAREIEEGRKNRLKHLEVRRQSCLSRWYPLVKDIVPTPETRIIQTAVDLEQLWDGKSPEGYQAFEDELGAVASEMGTPCFLRTGVTSGKHSWRDTCHLRDVERIGNHIYNIVEFCGIADLPIDTWVIRELLRTSPAFFAFHGRMPITKERRYFVRNGEIVCRHPYWPAHAIEGQNPSSSEWKESLAAMNKETPFEIHHLTELTERVGKAVNGFWSVDWLWAENEWYLIDMGAGDQSFHWEGCEAWSE